jgi:hypothetical protein
MLENNRDLPEFELPPIFKRENRSKLTYNYLAWIKLPILLEAGEIYSNLNLSII